MPDTAASASSSKTGVRSMTGFAPVSVNHAAWQVTGDLRSVNGRGLDLRLRVPDWIEGLEPALRKMVQAALGRGSVTLSLRVSRDDQVPDVRVNEGVLNGVIASLAQIEKAAGASGMDLSKTSAADIALIRGVLEQNEAEDDTSALRDAILKELDASLAAFDADRAREGAALAQVLAAQLADVETLAGRARAALGDRAKAARAAMERALARVMETTDAVDEARVAQELAVLAVKADVAEELDRLDTHIIAARDLLATSGPVGRKFDFLMQEFNREANTLCSKAQSAELTAIGLDLKAVIDQMREQVQNIE